MSHHFVVENGKQTVGVAVRVPGGFRFFYSDPQFRALDGQVFPRARNLARKVGDLARHFPDQATGGQAAFH